MQPNIHIHYSIYRYTTLWFLRMIQNMIQSTALTSGRNISLLTPD